MANRKASLNLSINAIVVLILAITILGLGLGFIKKQFSTATSQFDVTNQKLKGDIISELESSGELLTFKQAEFEIKSGTPQDFYLGIKNTDQDESRCFYLQWKCDDTLGSEDCASYRNGDNQWSWFTTYEYIELEPNTASAAFAKIQPSGTSDTYMGKLYVWIGNKAGGVPDGGCDTGDDLVLDPDGNPPTCTNTGQGGHCALYDSKEFYIKVI